MGTVAFALAIASTPFLALANAQAPASAEAASSAQPQSGVRAGFWWADYDRDGLDDAFVVGADGAARLLRNSGDGSFADVTMLSGLDGLGAASFAAWSDYDRDGAPDVFVGTQSGPGHLMRNAGDGTFQDVTQFVGIVHSGRHLAAQWFDYDLDGLSDLSVRTDAGEHLYHALPNGHFEVVDLGGVKAPPIQGPASDSNGEIRVDVSAPVDLGTSDSRTPAPRPPGLASSATPANTPPHTWATLPSPPPGSYFLSACPPKITDSANNNCLQASSAPTLGMLYPLSINLNVNGAGDVGIGTTTPTAKLEVAGTARIGNTLTLNPGNDHALDVNSGSIYMGGLLFAHTKGGGSNTAIGQQALSNVTYGASNTASGTAALYLNTTGFKNTAAGTLALRSNSIGYENTANGFAAMYSNTSGVRNTANGSLALLYNSTGSFNTASGSHALFSNTTGYGNTASGERALYSNRSGVRNTASGQQALFSNTTGKSNTASGYRALQGNSTGDNNTADGDKALFFNTTGFSNTATGARALANNTYGGKNTASGFEALFSNTSGFGNTANGYRALFNNTYYGSNNTAIGGQALVFNTTGSSNTASGYMALRSNTTGYRNTAGGYQALYSNTTGGLNTAIGYKALRSNTTGTLNTAVGERALYANTTGIRNIALGKYAGSGFTTGSDNIAIGNGGSAGEANTIRIGTSGQQTRTFIAGIRGVTTGNPNAIPVVIDSTGQLGTVSSSRRFKKDIVDMGDATENLLKLRPVRFRYKQEQTMPDGSEVPMEYGLIAEEVAEIFPDLVVYGDDGKPFTVKYHILSSMLLNEMKKQALENAEQSMELKELRERLNAVELRPATATVPAAAVAGVR